MRTARKRQNSSNCPAKNSEISEFSKNSESWAMAFKFFEGKEN